MVVTGSGGGNNPKNYQVSATGVLDGMPLLEDSQAFSSTVTSQNQIQSFANTLVNDFAPGMFITPTLVTADQGVPQIADVQLGDEARMALVSPLHPRTSSGAPGYMGAFRLVGWTLTFPSGNQTEETMYSFGAGNAFTLAGGTGG
jgi:hypothetical protein